MNNIDNKIYFSLPGFFLQFNLNYLFLQCYKTNTDILLDNVVIESFYDCFPCIWNGGRIVYEQFDQQYISKIVNYFNEQNYSLRYTFTNSTLSKEDFNDPLCNYICKVSNISKNGINVYDSELQKYIKSKYPNFYYLKSTTQCLTDVNQINNDSLKDIVVLDYSLNNNFDYLSKLTNRHNIEILLAETCIDNCSYRKFHYQNISEFQNKKTEDIFICPHAKAPILYYIDSLTHKHNISLPEIQTTYLPMGFNHYKISGRKETPINLLEKYLQFLVKPQYHEITRNLVLNWLWDNRNEKIYKYL